MPHGEGEVCYLCAGVPKYKGDVVALVDASHYVFGLQAHVDCKIVLKKIREAASSHQAYILQSLKYTNGRQVIDSSQL